jgi:hypothetical protein
MRALKVKIIHNRDYETLEFEINEFLAGLGKRQIKEMQYQDASQIASVMIVYWEDLKSPHVN